jgi:hypothetical protein
MGRLARRQPFSARNCFRSSCAAAANDRIAAAYVSFKRVALPSAFPSCRMPPCLCRLRRGASLPTLRRSASIRSTTFAGGGPLIRRDRLASAFLIDEVNQRCFVLIRELVRRVTGGSLTGCGSEARVAFGLASELWVIWPGCLAIGPGTLRDLGRDRTRYDVRSDDAVASTMFGSVERLIGHTHDFSKVRFTLAHR